MRAVSDDERSVPVSIVFQRCRAQCCFCAFWREEYGHKHGDWAEFRDGFCHRYAPRTIEPDGLMAPWPMTKGRDACGEWKQADAEMLR